MAHLASGCCHCAHCGKSSLTSTAIYSHMGIYNLALFCVFIVLTVENVYWWILLSTVTCICIIWHYFDFIALTVENVYWQIMLLTVTWICIIWRYFNFIELTVENVCFRTLLSTVTWIWWGESLTINLKTVDTSVLTMFNIIIFDVVTPYMHFTIHNPSNFYK